MKTRRLNYVEQLRFIPKAPFNFRLTFWKPSHFVTGLESHTATTSWRTFRLQGGVDCGVKAYMDGRTLVCDIWSDRHWNSALRDRLELRLLRAYALDRGMTEFAKVALADSALAPAWKALKGMRPSCPESVFEIAIVSLLLQNTTISRTTSMMRALLDTLGHDVSFAGRKLKIFFSPSEALATKERHLREVCRLGYRAKYFQPYGAFFAHIDDDSFRHEAREAVLQQLEGIKGVGPYTANVIASHALQDDSALPLDVWNRRIFARRLAMKSDEAPKVALAMRRRFRSLAGLAALYFIEHQFISHPLQPLEDEQTPNIVPASIRPIKQSRKTRKTL